MANLRYYNPNPFGEKVGDCVIRAICAATGQDWDTTFTGVTFQAFAMKNMPSSNNVWGEYLRSRGFRRAIVPNTCPGCYTINDFADDHATGVYVVGTGEHAVGIVNGEIWDTWDSRDESPIYYYYLEE